MKPGDINEDGKEIEQAAVGNTESKTAETEPSINQTSTQETIDIRAMRTMLDETKKSIDQKTRELDKQLVDAIDRMKKGTLATAKSASEDIASLAKQYDSIISGVQQNVADLRGTVSKLVQENDRMREMLLANDEKIEDLQLQISHYKTDTGDSANQPLMLILLGVGLLTILVLGVFIIFKIKWL